LGFVGVGAVLGTMHSPNRCVMEVPGEALRIASRDLNHIMEEVPLVREHLLTYVHALLIQNTQTALCNIRHELEERLCRWLLLASDRLDEKVIPLTHDQLAIILGVRRAGITTTLSNLANSGALIKRRGAVEINDRLPLEARTCECYRIIASAYKNMMSCGSYHHTVRSHTPRKKSAPPTIGQKTNTIQCTARTKRRNIWLSRCRLKGYCLMMSTIFLEVGSTTNSWLCIMA
jgi:hypothetical protein